MTAPLGRRELVRVSQPGRFPAFAFDPLGKQARRESDPFAVEAATRSAAEPPACHFEPIGPKEWKSMPVNPYDL